MSKGGWIVKFNDVEVERCYAISFDYDMWELERESLEYEAEGITIQLEYSDPKARYLIIRSGPGMYLFTIDK